MITASPLRQVQTFGSSGAPSALFPDGRHRLLYGDCLEVARVLPSDSFDAIYLDPPFFTGEDRYLHNGERYSELTYTDSWKNLHAYLNWLQERILEMHRLLKSEGVFFLHLDWHAVHYAKVMLDGLFGYDNFQNEFIWYYSGGGASRQRFARKHDSILFYSKSATHWKFYADRVRVPYRWVDGQKRADGSERDYARGKLSDDVWEHHSLMPWAGENLGYPTQKPETLLERLLLATTDEGDVVGDFFCGSGTTPAVAQRLGRRWVAADCSRVAICLTAERLAEQLAPGCMILEAKRSRARARERFDGILADEGRLGLDETALAAFGDCVDPRGCGVSVERVV
ncbi:MAG: DNA-methyltransferase [Armatimonadota bacterium]